MTLAYGVLRGGGVVARVGDRVVDLSGLDPMFDSPSLNAFMAAGPEVWRQVRGRLDEGRKLEGAELGMPFEVADYVDFYSSLDHATNLGRMFRPDSEPLLPNWRHLPVGYHGRSGTVVPSGTPVRRPRGQRPGPEFGPSARLDIELEAGFVIGTPSEMGEPVPVERALDHVFGMVLVNDWSARDIQAWEYQPLGPFLGKSFATSVSHWVVPLDELAERRVPREPQDPAPLPYLAEDPWAYDIALKVELNGTEIATSNTRHLYWSIAQQIAHLTVNGASLRTGDLLATGTISGPEREERGSLIELSWNGQEPIELADGSTRPRGTGARRAALRPRPAGQVGHLGLAIRDQGDPPELGCQRSWPSPTSSPWPSRPARPATMRRPRVCAPSRRSRRLPSRSAVRACCM
jgi:fumarylacetoacetase